MQQQTRDDYEVNARVADKATKNHFMHHLLHVRQSRDDLTEYFDRESRPLSSYSLVKVDAAAIAMTDVVRQSPRVAKLHLNVQ